jgi:rhamnogalacturonan endolyase
VGLGGASVVVGTSGLGGVATTDGSPGGKMQGGGMDAGGMSTGGIVTGGVAAGGMGGAATGVSGGGGAGADGTGGRGTGGSVIATGGSTGANIPGGGTTGPDVTVTDNGTTVSLSNGIVSIVITKSTGQIDNFIWNEQNLLTGGTQGGKVYWELQAGNGTYTLTADPNTNGGNQAEVRIHTTGSANNLDVDIDYALLRGNTGFYATGILSHPASYAATSGGEWRSNVYVGSTFDWLSVDSLRNKEMCTPADWDNGSAVSGAPKEVELLTTGIYKGQYECKYSYSADLGEVDAWGWSSSTEGIGIWVTKPSLEYYNGGPKKRELMCHTGPTMLNMLGGSHYGMGNDENIAAGTELTKIYGPFFYYANKVPTTTPNFHDVLFADAISQAKAEQAAWPYTWFKNTTVGTYVQESGRGFVTGTFAITDPGSPNASPAGMWIGLAPDNGTDFQFQFFTYQFWVKTSADGSFTIPHVLPGSYALYAFGPGAAGTFKKAGVTVSAGQKLDLGIVAWTPPRTAPTVWEIGIPDRDSHEFLNGAFNYSLWATSYVNYTSLFGNGITYTVGTDDYTKVWNYDLMGTGSWTVNFTMPKAPSAAQGRFYLALASNFGGSHLTISMNGTQIGSVNAANPSDAVVRLGSHGAFWDAQLLFNSNALKAGANTLTIDQTGTGSTLEWDYLRLEAE